MANSPQILHMAEDSGCSVKSPPGLQQILDSCIYDTTFEDLQEIIFAECSQNLAPEFHNSVENNLKSKPRLRDPNLEEKQNDVSNISTIDSEPTIYAYLNLHGTCDGSAVERILNETENTNEKSLDQNSAHDSNNINEKETIIRRKTSVNQVYAEAQTNSNETVHFNNHGVIPDQQFVHGTHDNNLNRTGQSEIATYYPFIDDKCEITSNKPEGSNENRIKITYPDGRVSYMAPLQNVKSTSIEACKMSTGQSDEAQTMMIVQDDGSLQYLPDLNQEESRACHAVPERECEMDIANTDENNHLKSSSPSSLKEFLTKKCRSTREQFRNVVDEINIIVQKGAKDKNPISKKGIIEDYYDKKLLAKTLSTLQNYHGEAVDLLSKFQKGELSRVKLTNQIKILKNKFSSHESRIKKSYESYLKKMQFEKLVEEFKRLRHTSTDLEIFQNTLLKELVWVSDDSRHHESSMMKRVIFSMQVSSPDTSDIESWEEMNRSTGI